jgi:precorrin-6B methylase 2
LNLIEKYSNKEVPFRFNGVNLSFFLSQSLFSSYSIDNGTKLLLKTIAKEINFSEIRSVSDIGCGVGVIGLSLKKKYPDLTITLQDRDALALSFSKENAHRNKIKDIIYSGELALEGLEENSQDLIISNLPAKAGESVLLEFVNSSLTYLSAGGLCVLVIVATLKDTILNAIRKTDAEITYKEDTRDYSVFHFKKIKNIIIEVKDKGNTDLRECYIRGVNDFQLKKLHYSLKAVYNLSGFDTIPYHIDLTAHLLEKQAISGRTLFWNPGQGHLPLITHLKNRSKITETILASRDILQLKISRKNLLDTLSSDFKETLELKHICCLEELSKDILYNSILISLDEPDETILKSIQEIIAPNGILIITGKSSYIAGAIKTNKGWIQITSRKYRGFRVVVFKRNSGNY